METNISKKFSSRMKFQKGDFVIIESGGNMPTLDGKTGSIVAFKKIIGYSHPSQGTPYLVLIPEIKKERWVYSSYMEIEGSPKATRLEKYKATRELRKQSKFLDRKIRNIEKKQHQSDSTYSKLLKMRAKVLSRVAKANRELDQIDEDITQCVNKPRVPWIKQKEKIDKQIDKIMNKYKGA